MLGVLMDKLGRKLNILVVAPHPLVVGNCAEQIFFSLLKAKREGKKIVFLFQYPLPRPFGIRLTNRELFSIDSEFGALVNRGSWQVLGNCLITLYGAVCRLLIRPLRVLGYTLRDPDTYPMVGHTTLWQPDAQIPEFSWDVVRAYDWPAQLKHGLKVTMSSRRERVAEMERELLGLPNDAWFVCLHVRESGFHEDTISERNANIANYALAIKEITIRGGWVVRMGDPSMTKLPVMERVIDYPFTSSKSALMDIYLISKCRVYMGMQSGIFDVAMLFQRPVILTNMASWFFPYPQKEGDLGILKHPYSRSRKRFLSVHEWMEEPWGAHSFVEALQSEYVLYENSPEELQAIVSEYFSRDAHSGITTLQEKMRQLRLKRGREYLEKNVVENDKFSDTHQRYRLASRLDSAVGLIGNEYLQCNWDRDALNSIEFQGWADRK